MQTCPSCQHPSPIIGFYCSNCPQQIRCKNCREMLLSGAKGCVMCGTPIGEGHNGLASSNEGSLPPVMNTLKFIETSKGHSREIEAVLSNEVGISWGGAAIAAIVGGQMTPGKPPNGRSVIRDLSNAEPQQLSLFNDESGDENNKSTIDTVAQLAAAHGIDADKLKHIFRHNGEQLQLMETRLKAGNRLDAGRRLTYLVLLYSLDVDGREEIPRNELNDILKRVGLYDNNAITWIGKSADLIVERDMVGLRLSGQEQARKVLAEVLDDKITGKWNLTTGATSRGSKSSVRSEEDSENSTKTSKRKNNVFSKEVESWVANWKPLASNIDFHAAIKDCTVIQKGLFGLWAIGKAISNPEIVVSSYKLKQFLYLGFGIKIDERHLERTLQAASGQGSLIKVQSGFQLLSPGLAEVERLTGSIQSNASTDESSENSGEV
ncbi:zinc ribbon domain-containing protein [Nostoc sp. LEGE 12450]|uniref:zinc ribbon domain-containing protein n=1 Tax=Nostoc sp. LEGE 12450 TaxID=1828643 RepID=UPI0018827328|nr:zinc ribbon domain-containing protein [Nostoc sp. LEGE 12450]MBE8987012.1 zinc ribbon domain-containing protein [Nostoc sp. LEGE 12450]